MAFTTARAPRTFNTPKIAPKTTDTGDALLARGKDMLAQTQAEGSKPFVGSSFDKGNYGGGVTSDQLAKDASAIKSTVPVATSGAAMGDLTTKLKSYQDILAGVQQQQQKIAQDNAARANAEALNAQDKQRNELEQKKLNIQQQVADTKSNLVAPNGLGSIEDRANKAVQYGLVSDPMEYRRAVANGTAGKIDDQILEQVNSVNVPDSEAEQSYYADALSKANTVSDNAYNQYKVQINQIRNGTFPLTTSQEAIVSATEQSFARAQQMQQQANEAYVGATKVAGFRKGGEYTPEQYAGQVKGAIDEGIQKIADLDSKQALTLADLQKGFDDENYKLINDSYEKFTSLMDKKVQAISALHESAVAHEKDVYNRLKDQRDFEQAQIDKLQKVKDDMLTSANAQNAPQSVKDAIANSQTTQEAITAAGQYAGDILDRQYKEAQIAKMNSDIKAANNDLSGIVSPVAQLPDGTYDTTMQDAILSQMSPADAALVKAVGTYTMDIAKVTSLRSDERQKLAQKVALVYPNFDMTNYATHAAYRKSLAGTAQGTTGGAINSANKVINHLTSYIDNVSKLTDSGYGGTIGHGINAASNAAISTFSPERQKALAEATTDATGVKDELAKFFKGSGVADVSTINDWAKTVNVNASPAEQQGAVQGAIELLQGQLVPMIDQYKQTMGQEPPPGLFLKTDTIAKLSKLKDEGFKIDIPGVNYTTKEAWQKYGAGTQDEWNAAVDSLSSAGLPLTEENILQAAQINY